MRIGGLSAIECRYPALNLHETGYAPRSEPSGALARKRAVCQPKHQGYADAWETMTKKHPDVEAGSSNSAFAHPEAGSGTLLGKQRFRFLTDGSIDQICCRKVFLEVAELDLKVDEKIVALQRHHLVAGCGET
jgi:hypothetical protein